MQTADKKPFSGWEMLFLCFLGQNLGQGLGFGSFGALLANTEQHFGITRAAASTGMSLIGGVQGVMAVLAGVFLLQRVSLRTTFIIGAILSAIGYLALAFLQSFGLALVAYGMIGTGICLLSVLGPTTLISRWFIADRGKVLGIVNLPIMILLTPYFVGLVLPAVGRLTLFMGFSAAFLLMIPLLFRIIDFPADVGQSPRDIVSDSPGPSTATPLISVRTVLTNPLFWLMSLAIGVVAGAGTAFMTHAVPFGMGQGLSLQGAAAVVSVYAGSGLIGCPLFGWIADRLGPPTAMLLNTMCQAVLWWGLLHVTGTALFILASLLGMCVVPIVTLMGATMGALFGAANVGRAMGIAFGIKLPFLFGLPPLIGFLFDRSGNYHLAFLVTAGLLVAASVCCALTVYASRRPAALAVASIN